MKVAAGKVEAFIADPPSKAQVILLYGPDNGLVRERAEKLKQAVIKDQDFAFRLADFAADNLKDDPGKLFDEAATISLTGERRVVQIREAEDFIAPIFAEFFILKEKLLKSFLCYNISSFLITSSIFFLLAFSFELILEQTMLKLPPFISLNETSKIFIFAFNKIFLSIVRS